MEPPGGTLYLFSKAAPPNATLISLDLPAEPPFYGYPRWKERIYKTFSSGKLSIYLARGDSHDRDTLDRVKEILRKRNIAVDVLFIDGDHSYEGCRKDFEMYGKLVKPGGIVAFHDIIHNNPRVGVPRFWREIKNRFKHFEIIDDPGQGECGIGVLNV